MKVDPDCRECADSSIFLSGHITAALVKEVMPDIVKLRAARRERITVYINSDGGFTDEADLVDAVLTHKDSEGYCPHVVTVAIGNARSAAATLLAFGNYAIAYPHAAVHFHGIRYSGEFEVTTEFATSKASDLQSANLALAMRLAERTVARAMLIYSMKRPSFAERRQSEECKDLSDVECFANALKDEVTSECAKKIVESALKSSQAIDQLSEHIFGGPINLNDDSSMAEVEATILKSIVDFEVQRLSDPNEGLTPDCVARITADYSLIRDYHRGEHREKMWPLLRRFGKFFLDEEQLKEYSQIMASSPEDAQKWLDDTARPMLQPFWYFVVCMWRALQEGENALPPQDAYWLGIIDEVAGTRLAAYRLAKEDDGAIGKTD